MKSLMIVILVISAGAVSLSAAFYILNRAASGKPAFYLWEMVSRKAHGGKYAEVNGIRLYYKTYGGGSPVVILHGGGGFLEMMHYQISALTPNRLVIAVDSRGQGRSTDSDEPLSYSLMAADVLRLFDILKIEMADIVGWSDGGIIGLDIAILHPRRVRRLVVIGANYDAEGLVSKPVLDANIPSAPGFYRRNAPDPAHWPILYRKIVKMQQTQPHYSLDELHQITAPTLVMAGEFDVIKREHTDSLAKAIVNSEEEIIKDGTHAIPFEKPDQVNGLMLKFLSQER